MPPRDDTHRRLHGIMNGRNFEYISFVFKLQTGDPPSAKRNREIFVLCVQTSSRIRRASCSTCNSGAEREGKKRTEEPLWQACKQPKNHAGPRQGTNLTGRRNCMLLGQKERSVSEGE